MARRFEAIGVNTVADFLAVDPETAAAKLGNKSFHADILRKWQSQTRLACQIPELRGHDAQLLVECGITDPEELASMKADELLKILAPVLETPEAARILRGGERPDQAEVTDWIAAANHARRLKAA